MRGKLFGGLFYGCGTALVTPFRGSKVDYDALERLIDRQIEGDADALIVLGTTAEPCTLTASERASIIECAVNRVAGRIPLYVGSGSNCTRTAIEQSVQAQRLGADGLLVVTPYYNRASVGGLREHYLCVADSVEIPIIVYNVPGRTGVNLPAELMPELAKHPLLCGFKEANPDLSHALRLYELVGDGIAVYCGNDEQTLAHMALGARGAISVAANIVPRQIHALTHSYLRGEVEASRALQFSLLPLMRALSCEANPIPVKAALSMMGWIENTLRLPLIPLEERKAEPLRRELERLRILSTDARADNRQGGFQSTHIAKP